MPKGLYSLRDRGSGTQLAYERFWCAVGPIGWRYAAEVLAPDGRTGGGLVDLTVDDRWRQLRVEVRSGGWQVRGGVAGTEAVWVRAHASGEQARESAAVAAGFTGRSPGFLVAVARMLGLAPGARVRLVALGAGAGAADGGDRVGAGLGRGTADEGGSTAGRVVRDHGPGQRTVGGRPPGRRPRAFRALVELEGLDRPPTLR